MIFTRRNQGVLAIAASAVLWAASLAPVQASDGQSSHKLNLWQPGDSGQRLLIKGRVSSEDGMPIPDATLYISQANGLGVFSDEYSGTLRTRDDGSYALGTVMPGQAGDTRQIEVFVSHGDFFVMDTAIRFKGDSVGSDALDVNAIVVEEATVNGSRVLMGEFNIVLPHQRESCSSY